MVGALIAAPEAESGPAGPPSEGTGASTDSALAVECTPVATIWPASTGGPSTLAGPRHSVVRIDTRPKDALVMLDDRYVGRARFFNGKKGYLYLEPGRYRLELRLGGYRTDVFSIEARPSCRFDIKHRMTRSHTSRADPNEASYGKGPPPQRSFAPVQEDPAPVQKPPPPSRPDRSLRPDLSSQVRAPRTAVVRDASLRLSVRPANASIYLDGAFLATGEELERMVGPLAVPAGSHTLQVMSPGFVTQEVQLDIAKGELEEVTVILEREGSR
jgi:hypothetical protein